MKKFYLFLSGTLLMSLPLMSQRPQATNDDPKIIFVQNFEPSSDELSAEDAWQEWQTTPVDTIRELYYYNLSGNSDISGSAKNIYDGSNDWKLGVLRTDSTTIGYEPGSGIILLNGVVVSNNKNDKANDVYNEEVYGIKTDGEDIERAKAFAKYGEDGGSYYFSYTSGNAEGADTYSSGIVKNYRRNLFVRGLPIEDNSSYRLTFYIKAKKLAKTKPTFYADVMRGYYNSEKPFSMGLGRDDGTFEYDKNNFNGEWEKVTFMTFYLNDSIADAYCYAKGYYWHNDWNYTYNGREYNYIKQPDKFFVRLSFASDSTAFELDNMTLTKSWIGGVEHSENMIRVDFGYETNLLELAKAAYAETNIAAVELPGQYFSVYGYYAKGGNKGWYPIEIASAEYHDDGYMYMWSKDTEVGGKFYPNPFTNYDSVLVSFINPVENEKIRLVYNSKLYPDALNTEWVEGGKTVKNFTNELSKLNPNIEVNQYGKKVYSMKNLPPVITSYPYENESFGLVSFNEIKVGMSRVLEYEEDAVETSEKAFLRVTKAGVKEIWPVTLTNDSVAVFTRKQADITKNGETLVGDYKFEFINLKGIGTDYAANVTVYYGFGDYDHNPDLTAVFQSDYMANTTENQSVPVGGALWNGKDKFTIGTGTNVSTKSRLYYTNPASGFTSGLYMSGRAEGSDNGHFAYGLDKANPINLQAGKQYTLSFTAAMWETPLNTDIYIYPADFDNLSGIPSMAADKKTLIGSFAPTVRSPYTTIQVYTPPYGSWPDGVESFTFQFSVPNDGAYIIEWEVEKNGTDGDLLSDFTIQTVRDLSFPYVSKLNSTVNKAQEKLDGITKEIYYGVQFDALAQAIADYAWDKWESTKPSAYNAATAFVENQIKLMQERMDTVDLYYDSEDKAIAKLDEFLDDTLGYTGLVAYKALEALADDNFTYECPEHTNAEIAANAKAYDDAVKALDDRLALNGKFNDKLAEIKKAIDDKDARKDYPEYAEMVAGYEDALKYDQITPDNEEFTAGYKELCGVLNVYKFKVDAVDAYTRQVKELYALADSLGFKFDEGIKAQVAALRDKDEKLESYLREAAILQILKIYASDDKEKKDLLADNFDASALIPNYYLYTEAQVDRDMEKNSSGNWRIKSGANTTAFPSWTINRSSGNWIPTNVKNGEGEGYIDWEIDGHAFIAGLRCKSQTKGTFGTVVEGLPQGFYWFGLYGYNQTSGVNYTLKTDSVSISENLNSWNGGSKFQYKELGKDSILVAGNLSFSINQTSSSSSELDFRYFILRLRGADPAYDYAAAANAQEQKLADLITFADAAAEKVSVQYFNLGGVEISAAKPGDIIIKRTVLSNGEAVVEKILVK